MDELAQLLGESPAITLVREKLRQLSARQPAGRRVPAMLIQGETGTGKGLVARIIHRMGPRQAGPFVDINCPAIPETLLEAELFGFERGAFTDAHRAKPGLFQAAHGGTLFLDEIGLLPASVQAKLLTAIEERSVRRLGSTRSEAVDACFISATNVDLQAALRELRFREDLYHRLAVITLELPALRDRDGDVLLLAERFLARTCADYGLPPKRLDGEAQTRLLAYAWPGNIRELANVIERAALFAESAVITRAMLELESPRPAIPATGAITPAVTPEEVMRQHLVAALERSGGNISLTAAQLGIARNTLYARLEKHGVRGPGTVQTPPRRTRQPEIISASVPTGTHVHWEPRGITLLSATLVEPEGVDAWSIMSRALDIVIDKLQTYGGRIEELTPTGILASFGVDPVDDAPRRAAHAALAIHKRVARAAESTTRTPGVKIGIDVAEVLVGRSETRSDIDADAKRAQRSVLDHLMEAIGTDETVASAAAGQFLERRFELVPIDGGAGTGDQPYRLTGQERRGLGLWGAMTQFVGRQDELEALRGRLVAAGRGHGQLVAVVGEPGVGKSRLFWEFTHSAHVDGWLVLHMGAVPYGKTTPYLPAIEMLKAYCGIGDRDDQRTICEKVTGKLLALDTGSEFTLPALRALLDLPGEDRKWEALDPAGRRRHTLDALKRLLIQESKVQPLVLVFEDLHWMDGETQTLLDNLVESLPAMRLMLLVNYRPEYSHVWGSKTYYRQLRVESLLAESAGELLDALLGPDAALGPLKQLLVERTEGNPFFLEESVRALVETAALAGERGTYRVTRPVEHLKIPATVQAILAARIDRLGPEAKRLLQAAAVIGKDVPMPLLLAIADAPEHEVRTELTRLQAAEFLYETRLFPDLEYTFKHALTHEVAYGGLLHDRQRALHARITEAIERLSPERVTEQVERLAHHALRGELWEKAVTYLRQAGLRAMARGANREAIAHLEQALGALRHLPETRETTELAIDIRLDLWNALIRLGEWARMGEHLQEAEGLARTLGDQHRLGRIATFMVSQCGITGDYDGAVRFGQEALSIARTLDDRSIEVAATSYLGITYAARGEFIDAAAFLERNVALEGDLRYERFGAPASQSALSGAHLAAVLSELGRFDEAIGHAETAVRIAEAADYPFTLHQGLLDLGRAHLRRGDLPRATRVLERNLDLCRTWQIVGGIPLVAATLGAAYALAGRADGALPLVAGAVEEFRRRQWHSRPALILLYAGMTYLSAGRIDEGSS